MWYRPDSSTYFTATSLLRTIEIIFIRKICLKTGYSGLREIKARITQGSVLVPVLYLLYTQNIPNFYHNFIGKFADDTEMLGVGKNSEEADKKLVIWSLDEKMATNMSI